MAGAAPHTFENWPTSARGKTITRKRIVKLAVTQWNVEHEAEAIQESDIWKSLKQRFTHIQLTVPWVLIYIRGFVDANRLVRTIVENHNRDHPDQEQNVLEVQRHFARYSNITDVAVRTYIIRKAYDAAHPPPPVAPAAKRPRIDLAREAHLQRNLNLVRRQQQARDAHLQRNLEPVRRQAPQADWTDAIFNDPEMDGMIGPGTEDKPAASDDVQLENVIKATAPAVSPFKPCPICSAEVVLYRVSYCCTHMYCRSCICEWITKNATKAGLLCPDPVHTTLRKLDEDSVVAVSAAAAENTTSMDEKGILAVPSFVNFDARHMVDPQLVRDMLAIYPMDNIIKQFCLRQLLLVMPAVPPNAVLVPHMCWSCNTVNMVSEGSLYYRCGGADCTHSIRCTKCAEAYHPDITCVDAKQRVHTKEETQTRQVCKQCPKCKTEVVHYRGHGCHHMTCSQCNCKWCWVCMRDWSKTCHRTSGCNIMLNKCVCTDVCHCSTYCTPWTDVEKRHSCDCPPCFTCTVIRPCDVCVQRNSCPGCMGVKER